jgi:uncharacterized protein (DUF924 family)
MERASDILEYWFGTGDWTPARLAERTTFWFGGDGPAAAVVRDADIRTRLEPMLERASRGEFAGWRPAQTPAGIDDLFDQVPRNAYRGRPPRSRSIGPLALAVEGLQLAADAALDPTKHFFYLPLEHAESLDAGCRHRRVRAIAEAPADLRVTARTAGYAQAS